MVLRAINKIRMGKEVISAGTVFEDSNKKRIEYLLAVGAAESVKAEAPVTSADDALPEGEIVLEELSVKQLRRLAKEEGLSNYGNLNKNELVELLAGHFGAADGSGGDERTGTENGAGPDGVSGDE